MTEIADVRIALADEWASFLVPKNAQGKRTQAENWRHDNPGEWERLLAYRAGGPRPTPATQLGDQMVEHVDAWHLTGEAPDPLPSTAKLVAHATYAGFSDVDQVPLWKTHGEQAKMDDRMTIVTDPLGQRGPVMRVEVRPGDSQVAGSNGGERADVMASASAVPMKEGSIVAVSCPIMLPDQFQSNNSGWNVPFGGHDASGGTQSPIQFEIRNSKDLRLRIFGGTASGGSGDFRRDFALAPLAKNRWYHLVYGNLFSWEPTKGRTVVYLDGKKILDEKVANLYRGSYCYHKQGWYRVAQPETTVLYMGPTHFWTADTLDTAVKAASG